ncbi:MULTISPECIES: hypothetical protein [unclassified Blastomonas]|uniref:hypothetical protein n=1 Tax=unclassified Blastomonas TaxID=2626550 RepID=UPI000826A50A|nr:MULTISPECIES: hypothetical protein [unclassified Blastomonas]
MTIPAAFANIAARMSGAIGAPFIDATAEWPGTPTLTPGGSIATPGTPVIIPCRVQFDAVTHAMRARDDYQDRDVRILVLGSSLSRPIDSEATITVETGPYAGSWLLRSVTTDPAGIGYECLGRRE